MKKKFILMLTVLAGVLSANADNVISIGTADIPQGGQGVIEINLDNEDVVASFQFSVTLPEGFSFVLKAEPIMDETGKEQAKDTDGNLLWRDVPVAETTDRTSDLGVSSSVEGQKGNFLVSSSEGGTVTGNSGSILYVKVISDGTQEIASQHATLMDGIVLSKYGAIKEPLADVDFDVNVEEPGMLLDENYAFVPDAGEGKVIVKRTINAGEWSTLCLPFDMTDVQVKEVFGDDVQLAEFSSYAYDSGEDQIELNFEEYDLEGEEGIWANTPYLIKTSKDISKFSLDETEVYPNEADAVKTVGKGSKKQRFFGILHATTVPENSLFLSGNKFYYSAGLTKIKAFRCYFTFTDILADGARAIDFNVEGTTGINNAIRELPNNGNYYNLKGQRVEKPSKGVFIVNGKKVVVK